MGDGRYVRGGRMARGSAQDGRGLDAHGLLRGILSGGAGQLSDRSALWLAMDVCHRRIAGTAGEFYPIWSERTEGLGKQSPGSSDRVCFPAIGGTVSSRVSQTDDRELVVRAGLDYRLVGRVGVRACGDYGHYQSQ